MYFGFSVLLCFIAAALLGAALNSRALRPWNRTPNAHWTVRTRSLWPVHTLVSHQLFFVPIVVFFDHDFAGHGALGESIPRSLAALAGTILGTYPIHRQLFPSIEFRVWLRAIGARWTLSLVPVLVLISGIFLMPSQLNFSAVAIALVVFVLYASWNLGIGVKLGRLFGFVVPADERLDRLIAEVAERYGQSPPPTEIIRSVTLNAFALPFQRRFLVTDRLLHECNDDEVRAVLAHEMGHLAEPRSVFIGRLSLQLALLPLLFVNPAMEIDRTWGLLAIATACLVLTRAARTLACRMEVRADSLAHTNADPTSYARVLEKLYRLNHVPAVLPGVPTTHPHLYDRLLAAGLQPDYPRPAPAPRFTWVSIILGLVLASTLAASVWHGETYHMDEYTSSEAEESSFTSDG